MRIPSISADPAHVGDVGASADAVAALMQAAGLERVRQAAVDGSPPYVVGEWLARTRRADRAAVRAPRRAAARVRRPLVGRSVRARASATAGCSAAAPPTTRPASVAHVAAVRARGCAPRATLPCNVKVLVEGEEEIGSPAPRAVPRRARRRAARRRAAPRRRRQLVGRHARAHLLAARPRRRRRAAARARRPAAQRHGRWRRPRSGPRRSPGCSRRSSTSTATPRSTAAGTTTQPPDAAERARLDALPAERRPASAPRGACATASRSPATRRRSVYERLWLRPAVTVIGIDGHPIEGSSNQIVAEAAARISVRVGRGQDPARLNAALRDHLERRVPCGLELTVHRARRPPAWHCDPTGWAFDAADARAARRRSASTPSTWASAARSRSSARSPTRSAASPRCCSAPPTPAAASTARTRASTSATGTTSPKRDPPPRPPVATYAPRFGVESGCCAAKSVAETSRRASGPCRG